MAKFSVSSKSNPCPICGDETGKCRSQSEIFLCMTLADSKEGEIINGHKCIKHSKDRLWAIFKIDNSQEWSEEQRREWQLRVEEKKRWQAQEQAKREAESLSLIERDRQYRELLAELTLSPEDEKDLLRRGFTHLEIELCGIKSVKRYQQLQKRYSELLPGVAAGGKQLITDEGYLIPIRNSDNLIVACQVRMRVLSDGNRYRWLSSRTKKNPSGQSPHVYSKGFTPELPLSIHRPEGEATGIAIVEGTGAKPFLTAQRLNLIAIGAAGGQWVSSKNLFKTSLDKASEELGGLKIVHLYPDAGDVANKQVLNRWKAVFELLQDWGWEIKIAWWGQFSKEDNDIDELKDYAKIGYLSPEGFWELVERFQSTQEKLSPASEDSPNHWAWEQWRRSRKFTAHYSVELSQFSFKNLSLRIPESDVIVAVKSGLGTGKTEALIELIKASKSGACLLGYRNNLLRQTESRSRSKGLTIYLTHEDEGYKLIPDDNTHQAFCLDSVKLFDGYFHNRDIYLDETCSVILHAVNGGTLGDSQAQVIKIFTRALNLCNRVILLDGNLSDLYVDFIAKLAPDKKVIKIENTKKIPPHQIKIVRGFDEVKQEIKKRDKSPLIKMLCSPGVKPWIASDSKELTKVLNEILSGFNKRGYCLNAETAEEPWAKVFLADPDAFIARFKPDYFIISPSAESGISITIRDYFTDKFTFFTGVQGTNSQNQMLFRLRDSSIPHYVFCPTQSFVRDRSTPQTYSLKTYEKIVNERIQLSALFASQSSEQPERVLETIGKAIARSDDAWFELSCKLGTLDNFEMDSLRDCLVYSLEDSGHNVEIINWQQEKEYQKLEKSAKEAVQKRHADELFQAEELSSIEEAIDLKRKSPTKEVQRRIEKTFLLDRLPGIKESEVWSEEFIYACHIKNKDFINQQQRFWLLNNFEVSEKKNEVDWFYKATNENFFIASTKHLSHLTIWVLKELNVLQFISGEWHKDCPEVVEFVNKARENKEIGLALKTQPKRETFNGRERIEFLSRVLNSIGLKLKSVGQKTIDGIRKRVYQVDQEALNDPKRLAVLNCVETKFTKWFNEKSQVNWEPEILEPPTVAPLADQQPKQEIAEEWLDKENLQVISGFLQLVGQESDKNEALEKLADLRRLYPREALKQALQLLDDKLKGVLRNLIAHQNSRGFKLTLDAA